MACTGAQCKQPYKQTTWLLPVKEVVCLVQLPFVEGVVTYSYSVWFQYPGNIWTPCDLPYMGSGYHPDIGSVYYPYIARIFLISGQYPGYIRGLYIARILPGY
jgi:hypothetical protein